MAVPFTKMQGAGNDFVVLDGRALRPDWPALAVRLCDRRRGIGADGLLVALPASTAATAVRMRMFNSDGTEDDCGNGLRCLALYAHRRWGGVPAEFRVQTLSGAKRVVVLEGREAAEVRVELGRAILEPRRIPAALPGDRVIEVPLEVGGEKLTVTSLFTGSTHTVLFETPDEPRFQHLSPLIEHHAAFPERTTVLWAQVVSQTHARVRIWERGAGETLACGTGAAAVAVAAHLTGRTGATVTVESAGGTLLIEIGPDLTLHKTGPAAFVFEGIWRA